ncbi:MAG: dodecin domain-containing protein [Porphyromonadaceae bacterium]|jgi:flavin-binding protein dodecin|nr:dodecin domain-containing protein [Porphyromonadaceae bacterium]
MAVLKVIEVLASSKTSWEDAAKNAVKSASKSLQAIRSIYIKEQSAVVENGEIAEFRINAKITFEVLED